MAAPLANVVGLSSAFHFNVRVLAGSPGAALRGQFRIESSHRLEQLGDKSREREVTPGRLRLRWKIFFCDVSKSQTTKKDLWD